MMKKELIWITKANIDKSQDQLQTFFNDKIIPILEFHAGKGLWSCKIDKEENEEVHRKIWENRNYFIDLFAKEDLEVNFSVGGIIEISWSL